MQITTHPEGGYLLTSEVEVPRPLEEVFAFFSDAHNLQELTPPWLNFQVLTPAPIEMKPGALIDYKLRLRMVPIRWQSKISSWEPPYRFVDEQTRGPYRKWYHEHTFSETSGGTLVQDQVHYRVPGGRLVHALLVGRDVRNIFEYRLQTLSTIFAASEPSESLLSH